MSQTQKSIQPCGLDVFQNYKHRALSLLAVMLLLEAIDIHLAAE